ncbi:MAG: GNAT family N-acetyltransferase [Lachnospiraceae bacterium]|nr:GNAT family N-acetyltransferase [Lachnospiraceae bacterium]
MKPQFIPVIYKSEYEPQLIEFLDECLPESGRALDINGRHRFYKDIDNSFIAFWCMFDGDKVIGAVGVKDLDNNFCELKSLYVLERYHRNGYGRALLNEAIKFARDAGYNKMYLDSLSTSVKAIELYRKNGFVDVEKYNQSERSDVFMVLVL